MANSVTHASLPYCVKGARFSLTIPYVDANGTPTDPTTPDTEIAKDWGTAADCAEEVAAISGATGLLGVTLSGAETDCYTLSLNCKSASGPKPTLATIKPKILPVLFSGTASAGAGTSITLPNSGGIPSIANLLIGCIVRTTGGTGGGGTGGANNQARMITAYSSGRVCTVPTWEVNPSSDTTFEILHTEFSIYSYADIQTWLGAVPIAMTGTGYLKVHTYLVEANAILNTSFNPGAIEEAAFAQDAITDFVLGPGAITAAKIGDGAITAAKILDDAITAAKIDTTFIAAIKAIFDTDTIAQLAQGAPPSAPTAFQAFMWMYQYFRNKHVVTATESKMYNDAGDTVISKSALSDNGTEFVKAEYVTGP